MNKTIPLLVTLFLCASISFAQSGSTSPNTRIDSLKNELIKAKEDTSAMYLLINLSKEFLNLKDYENTRMYATRTIALTDKLISDPSSLNKFAYINQCRKAKASAINLIGVSYHREGNYPEALKNYLPSLKIREETSDTLNIAYSYENIGQVYQTQSKYAEALENYSGAFKIWKQIGNKPGIAKYYNTIGIIHTILGNYTEALENHSASLKIKEEIGDKAGLGNSYNNIAIIYGNQGNYTESLKNHAMALRFREEVGDKKSIASSYTNIGIIYEWLGNHKEAIKNQFASLKIREEIDDHPGMASSYSGLGIIYDNQGRFTEAMENHLKALKIFEELEDKNGIGSSYSNIGNIYYDQGNYIEALKYQFKALKISKAIGNKPLQTKHLMNIGINYAAQENFAEALKYYSASGKMANEIGDKNGIAGAYNNIGNIYYSQGNNSEALKNYLLALKIKEEIGGTKDLADNYTNIGMIHLEQGNYAEALKNQFTALKIREETDDKKGLPSSYLNIGSIYREQGDYTEALKYYSSGLKIASEFGNQNRIAASYYFMGMVYEKLENYPEALKNHSEALRARQETGERAGIIYSYNHIGNIYECQKNYAKALETYFVSFDSTRTFLSENFNSLTENDKSSFKKEVIKNSDHLFTSAYFIKSDFDVSLQWLYNYQLFQRGIVLESSSGLAAAVQQDSSLREMWAMFSGYKNIIGKEYLKPNEERRKDLSALEDSANIAERELLTRSVSYRNWKERVNTTWQDVQKHLAKDEAAIEFVSFKLQRKEKTDSVMYAAMVLTADMKYPKLLFLFEEKPLASLLRNTAMRGMKLEIAPANSLQHGDSLYKLIFEPLLPYLKNIKTISFATDGLMHKINLASISGPNGKPLCETYKLKQMASTRSIVFPSPEPAQQPAAFFGGIDYTYQQPNNTLASSDTTISVSLIDLANRTRGGEFDFLPGTKLEAEDLGNLYKTKKFSYRLIEGKSASEKTFKQLEGNSPAVLHIATHGFFFPAPVKKKNYDLTGESGYTLAEDPLLRSGLVMAGGNYTWEKGTNPYEEEDGILTAYEISHLNLSTTDLVVLSACETGLGDIKGSEGVYGLQRAFKMAGVKYIIMSLWQLPDKETREFMLTFYNKWLGGEKIRSAFQDTQREMSKKYDPYKWAAFVLVE